MCVCSVWKHLGERSPSVGRENWNVQLHWGWREVLGLVWRLPCGTAAWWGHWCGTTTPQQPQPGGIVVTHQTSTQLSFRLQGRYSWCFQISLLFIVRNHKALLTLFREVEMEKGGLFTVPVTANKHPGIIRVASACPKLKTHKKCRFMLLSACPFPANLWFRS